jgi:hypothetical protein
MSFSSNVFTNLPLVHTQNPDFLGQQLWLCFSVGSWMSSRVTPEPGPRQIPDFGFRFLEDSCMSPRVTPELGPRQIPESAIFRSSRHRQLEIPGFRVFVTPPLHQTMMPEFHAFANPRLHRSQASGNREFPVPEKHVSRTLSNLTFRGWRVFLNSPTTSALWPRVRLKHAYCPCLCGNLQI